MSEENVKRSKARSPAYPSIGLKDAVGRVEAIYNKDYQSAIPRHVIAGHMGYQGLSGKALAVLSSLSKYGLLEGRGDDSRVSDLAVAIIAHPSGSAERIEALKTAAAKPELFSELDGRFNGGRGSDANIRAYLMTQKFIPPAADSAIRSYRETKQFVDEESMGYNPPEKDKEDVSVQSVQKSVSDHTVSIQSISSPSSPTPVGIRKAIFSLSEGDVTITYPEELSPESVQDLADYLEIFMKKAKRESGLDLVS